MSYSANMAGLDLFTAPFHSTQASGTAAASRPQQPEAAVPQPVKPEAAAVRTQEPGIPQKSVPEEKKKELSMDMSDRTVPAGKPLDASEDARRKAHEEAEAKRRAEWEAGQLAKKQAEEAALEKIKAMSDADIVSASAERVRTDVEKLTRRNMKECVADHIQSVCRKDPAFARRTMHPGKSMIHCFRYISRMAKDYIRQEMEDNDLKPENGIYGSDVPDGLVYQWSVDYFNDMDAEEDHVEEEKFIPRPYVSTSSRAKGTAKPKKAGKKQEPKKNDYQQMSLQGV